MADINPILEVMRALRDKNTGCPWDLKQTMESIVPYTLEEAYELSDAIEQKDIEDIKKECGDLLFQVVFYSQIAKEQGWFDFDGICQALEQKLVTRHPHVFSDVKIKDEKEQSHMWEEIKSKEQNRAKVLDDVPLNMPSLSRAQKIQNRAAKVGFDWENIEDVIAKIEEEVAEIKEAVNISQEAAREELGDLMFVCANLARWLEADAEQVLRKATSKFERRFNTLESKVDEMGQKWDQYSIDDLEQLWQNVKQLEKPA